jgi:hypothetical protein
MCMVHVASSTPFGRGWQATPSKSSLLVKAFPPAWTRP